MGKDLKGNELGKGISQRKDGLYQARIYASSNRKAQCFYRHDPIELKKRRDYLVQFRNKTLQILGLLFQTDSNKM